MADYACDQTAGGAGTGADWANAFTTFAAAIAAATSPGDRIFFDEATYSLAAGTYTVPAGVEWHGSNDTANFPPQTTGTFTITNPNAGDDVAFVGGGKIFGMKWTANATGVCFITFGGDAVAIEVEDVVVDLSANANAGSGVIIGGSSANPNEWFRSRGLEVLWGHVGQGFVLSCPWRSDGDNWCAGATVPTVLFESFGAAAAIEARGTNLSAASGTLFANATAAHPIIRLTNPKLHASATVVAASSNVYDGAEVFIFDGSSGDVHVSMAHYNSLGSTVVSTAVHCATGDAGEPTGVSWFHNTTTLCSFVRPYYGPWMDAYHEPAGAITPSIEVLRSGSATAYTDGEIHGDFSYKGTSGSTLLTFVSDRKARLAAAANQASSALGTSEWTGEHGSLNWFGKLAPASSFTPAEAGYVSARVVITAPSLSLYSHPFVRGVN